MLSVTNQILNYKDSGPLNEAAQSNQPLVLVHGLFGSLDNLAVLARQFEKNYRVIQVDLRNHGRSFHHSQMTYTEMATDLANLLAHLEIKQAIFIGHSMGGKAVMKMASLYPESVRAIGVLDMAPVAYQEHRHLDVFEAIQAVADATPQSRSQAMSIMKAIVADDGVGQFLGKSLYQAEDGLAWRFNYPVIIEHYLDIMGWQAIAPNPVPALFIKGSESDYIQTSHQAMIRQQFPNSRGHIVQNAAHWLHAEKPSEVMRALQGFLDKLEI